MRTKHSKLRSPVIWIGGKGMMTKEILPLLPLHKQYVEPFGGGASILFAKRPSLVETYNDIDSGAADLFRVLADPKMFLKFQKRVELLPYSRELYNEYVNTWEQYSNDIIERTARWFVVIRQSFSGIFAGGWSFGVKGTSTQKWLSTIHLLPEIHKRLQCVQIENRDFRFILQTYDGQDYLAYCDPPYVLSTRSDINYKHEMIDKDHQDLIKILLNYQGSVVLSGYDNPLYFCLEQKGWSHTKFCVSLHPSLVKDGKQRPFRIESVWRNPKALSKGFGYLKMP